MGYPQNIDGTQLCIAVTKEGIKLYGNRQAFQALANWMTWIANAEESQHHECHVMWHLEAEDASQKKSSKNTWVLFDQETSKVFSKGKDGFDVTFMAVEGKDLDELAKHQQSGMLPDGWNREDS